MSKNFTVVVECRGIIVGFGDIDDTAYFDHLFTHRDYQGIGVASIIRDNIEKYAKSNAMEKITVAASITAKPFFEKHGYIMLKEQQVQRNGQTLINYLMKKDL